MRGVVGKGNITSRTLCLSLCLRVCVCVFVYCIFIFLIERENRDRVRRRLAPLPRKIKSATLTMSDSPFGLRRGPGRFHLFVLAGKIRHYLDWPSLSHVRKIRRQSTVPWLGGVAYDQTKNPRYCLPMTLPPIRMAGSKQKPDESELDTAKRSLWAIRLPQAKERAVVRWLVRWCAAP